MNKNEIIDKFINTVSYGVYEEEDFDLTEKTISIDLTYDSTTSAHIYTERYKEKFPGAVDVNGTKVTLHFDKIEGASNVSERKKNIFA